ncbi:hypothetical protein ABT173_43015 [Streptomyces sp. NPDC001795]|uniref:hypothetical protein n=1 Tax=Streptomyces sp. NPDC001795 TaxID=3154525 RepID=UPI003327B743
MTAAGTWHTEARQPAEHLGLPAVRAHVRSFRGTSAAFQGRLEEARALHEAAVDARTGLGQEPEALFGLFQPTLVQSRLGDHLAEQTGRSALAMTEAHGDRWGQAQVLWMLAQAAPEIR